MVDQRLQIGWIGTGVMGLSMAGHLVRAEHHVRVHTRTSERASPLIEAGARWAESPAVAAESADVVISIVGYPEDVQEVHLGPEGTLSAKNPPRVLIDMTTSSPELARRIAHEAAKVRCGSLDAPVSGGDIGARNATLSIMVGGDAATFTAVRPIFSTMGQTVVHHGPPGCGQHAKMINQILIASTMMGVCEGLVYAKRAGLNPTAVIESVGSGAAGSWSINNLGPRIIREDFNPGFYVEHFVKDLGIALHEASRMNLCLPGLALARQLYEAVRANGMGRLGTQALYSVLARLSGLA